jgi:hypothetical protein
MEPNVTLKEANPQAASASSPSFALCPTLRQADTLTLPSRPLRPVCLLVLFLLRLRRHQLIRWTTLLPLLPV